MTLLPGGLQPGKAILFKGRTLTGKGKWVMLLYTDNSRVRPSVGNKAFSSSCQIPLILHSLEYNPILLRKNLSDFYFSIRD